jgi:hypothetical protein
VSFAQGRWALEALTTDKALRWGVLRDGARLSQRRWIEALRDEGDARAILTEALRAAPFRAYLWETPALDHRDIPAEMAILESPRLGLAGADPAAFAGAFREAAIATFANLGGDSLLVAPHPAHARDAGHLAAFVRSAPDAVIDALWIAVGDAAAGWRETRAQPLWISTSGLAVPWLHVRLDGAPKYYAYRAYARA